MQRERARQFSVEETLAALANGSLDREMNALLGNLGAVAVRVAKKDACSARVRSGFVLMDTVVVDWLAEED